MANLFRRLNPARALNGLWRHGDFVRLWSSLTITHFGGQITFLALPLAGALLLDAVGFLVGLGTVCGWPAYQVFMTERVGRGNLVEANAKIGVSDSAAQLVGPGIAGALIQWLTAPFAILLDAMSFFLSAWI